MITHNNEKDLWIKVSQGDVNAFNLVFEYHYKSLCISALLLVKDEKTAEDVVQDVFLKIWSKRMELGQVGNMASYLYISVKNSCLDQLRKTRITDDINEVEISDGALDPFHSVRIKELSKQLEEAKASLPLQCKVIFEMVYIEGKKYQEVADELGLSINTIKTQLKRALAKMRAIMEKFR
ncbi:RNA polymerase sigma factor [Pedobacter sp. UBA4863]|uniref:RNA polymerase sigma factor n=1 Tax=Pedobacter sp. UBA4863 TaxID=1947060 RepID=UPI0025DBF53A|nr:RNA polymerase sigma-70 factor [Pedobacter sp. UBA4863]